MPNCVEMIAWTFGPVEIALIAVAALLVFGSRLPEVGKSLGRGIVEFKRGLRGVKDEIEEAGADEEPAEPDAKAPVEQSKSPQQSKPSE